MQHTITSRLSLLALAAIILSAPVFGQRSYYERSEETDSIRRQLRKQMESELGSLAFRFWEQRLNTYKLTIDDIFSSRDLADLSELRVRFAILVERMRREEEMHRRQYEEYERQEMERATTTVDTTVMVESETVEAEMTKADLADAEAEINMAAAEVGEVTEGADIEEAAFREEEYRRARMEERETQLDAVEAALERGKEAEEAAHRDIYREMEQLPNIASWLARDYCSQLDFVADNVRLDLLTFADTLDAFATEFVSRHAAELARLPEYQRELFPDDEIFEIRATARRPLTFRKTYVGEIERFVLLYDGEGLGKLLGSVPGALVGRDLPDNSLVEEAVPNPATTTTTLSYQLPDESRSTTIRLYSASGELLREINEGARPAGRYETSVDVSELPSGWYLCRLTVQLPSGERVSAKAVQVVR